MTAFARPNLWIPPRPRPSWLRPRRPARAWRRPLEMLVNLAFQGGHLLRTTSAPYHLATDCGGPIYQLVNCATGQRGPYVRASAVGTAGYVYDGGNCWKVDTSPPGSGTPTPLSLTAVSGCCESPHCTGDTSAASVNLWTITFGLTFSNCGGNSSFSSCAYHKLGGMTPVGVYDFAGQATPPGAGGCTSLAAPAELPAQLTVS